jgi:hypothetical protein
MTTRIHANSIITKKLDLDLEAMESSCHQLYELVIDKFRGHQRVNPGKSTPSTELFMAYNLFLYPHDQFHELFHEVNTAFREHCRDDKKYYIQCWLNYYRAGEFCDWHDHWSPQQQTWHGIYCVHTEPSHTSYKLPGIDEPIEIPSEHNLLLLSRSDGFFHRSSPWHDATRPRITIAFDIVPKEHIAKDWLNHWIPL